MRDRLIQYVELLFAAAPDAEDIKQEILQNTLDRYDDLVAQGKSPEAAYRLAISGIGDINEILGSEPQRAESEARQTVKEAIHAEADEIRKRNIRAVAVAMYILCPVPLFILSEFGLDTMGLCFTLALVAAATALMMLAKKDSSDTEQQDAQSYDKKHSPRQELKKGISNVIWAVGLALYFILSFFTGAWYITWLMFPIIGSVQGLANAIVDLKEANNYEN